jgi:predicted aspartyl protease
VINAIGSEEVAMRHNYLQSRVIPEGTWVSRFSVDVEIANYGDLLRAQEGSLPPAKVRRKRIRGVIDSGAARLVLPENVVEELGLPIKEKKVKVRYADGRKGLRKVATGIWLELLGRDTVFEAIIEPKRETALIGALVLEALDLLVDCTAERLVPRDPKYVFSEIE